MIHLLDEALRQLIQTETGYADPDVEVSFSQPTGDWAAGLTHPVINCYLYDVRENIELRSEEWTVDRGPNGYAARRVAPLRFDVSYLITVWTQDHIEDEHAMLWRVMQVLATHEVLPEQYCDAELRAQPYPVRCKTGQATRAIDDLPDLWSVMDNPLRPSINYVVTLAMERPLTFEGRQVVTKRIDLLQRQIPDAAPDTILQIGGIVHNGGESPSPLSGASVTLVETAQQVVTDRLGRFRFRHVPAGHYTLLAEYQGKRGEREIVVPLRSGDSDLYDIGIAK
jgi:hypothetical protein